MVIRRFSFLSVLYFLVLSYAVAKRSKKGSKIFGGQDDFAEFDRKVEEILRANRLRGASVAVVHRDYGVLHVKGYGNRNGDHVFLAASVSKFVVASVLSSLHYRGLVNIFAPIRSYMPSNPLLGWWGRGPWDLFRDDFTIEQALSNLSGLPGLLSLPLLANLGCSLIPYYNLQSCGRDQYNVAPQVSEPGTYHRYGGGQWQIAGAVAEHVSNKSWKDLLGDVFAPCNLGTLGFTNEGFGLVTNNVAGLFTSMSYPSDWNYNPNMPPNHPNPFIEGGLYADALSVGKLLLMLLRGGMCENGRVMSEDLVRNMFTDRGLGGDLLDISTRDTGYGMGLWSVRDEPGEVWMSPGIYGAIPWVDIENGFGVILMLEANFDESRTFSVIGELGWILRCMFW